MTDLRLADEGAGSGASPSPSRGTAWHADDGFPCAKMPCVGRDDRLGLCYGRKPAIRAKAASRSNGSSTRAPEANHGWSASRREDSTGLCSSTQIALRSIAEQRGLFEE